MEMKTNTESKTLSAWLAEQGRKGGSVKSPAKAAASRANAKKPRRPKTAAPQESTV